MSETKKANIENGGKTPTPAALAQRRLRRWATRLCWSYFAGLVLVLMFLRMLGDRWWPTVPLLYGPQWIWAVPLPVSLAGAALARSRWAWGSVVFAAALLVPLTGLQINFARSSSTSLAGASRIKVITCNMAGRTGAEGLFDLIAAEAPDVIALQEAPADQPLRYLELQGWHVWHGKGLAVASRYPIASVETFPDRFGWRHVLARCDLKTPGGVLHFFTIHLATPRHEIEAIRASKLRAGPEAAEFIDQRRQQSEAARQRVNQATGPRIVAGDFNLVEASAIYRSCWGDLTDAFDAAGVGFGNTKFTRLWGVRIDHVLSDGALRTVSCRVGKSLGSDHSPVIVEFEWLASR